jgi:hypothetical protein
MSAVFNKANVQIIHAVSGEDFFDCDNLFALTVVPNWCKPKLNYNFVSLIDDEPEGTNCIGRCWENLDPSELDAFVRTSVVNYYAEMYGEDDGGFIWEAIENLELHYL